jgi:hypothetical protein
MLDTASLITLDATVYKIRDGFEFYIFFLNYNINQINHRQQTVQKDDSHTVIANLFAV